MTCHATLVAYLLPWYCHALHMLCQYAAAISPMSKGSELMPSWNKPKSLGLLRHYIVLKTC